MSACKSQGRDDSVLEAEKTKLRLWSYLAELVKVAEMHIENLKVELRCDMESGSLNCPHQMHLYLICQNSDQCYLSTLPCK